MARKSSSIENIDEQIKKLEKRDKEISVKSLETIDKDTKIIVNEDTDTRIFNGDENTDTKIFDSSKVIENEKIEVEESLEEKKDEGFVSDSSVKKRNNSKKKVVIVCLVSLIILLTVVVGVILYNSKDSAKQDSEPDVETELTDSEKEKLVKSYGEALVGVIGVYYSKQGVLLEYEDAVKLVDFEETVNCKIHEIYNDGSVYLNECSVNGVMTKFSYGEKQDVIVESSDEILNVYVNKNNKIATLSKPKNEDDYDKYVVHCGSIYSEPFLLTDYGDYVLYYDSEYRVQMKNYKTDEKFLPNIDYQELLPINISENIYDTRYLALKVNEFWGIYNINDGSSVITPMYSYFVTSLGYGIGPASSISAVDENLIIAYDGKNYGVINYTNNKPIIPFEYRYMTKSGNYIWATDYDGKGYIYDVAGNSYLNEGYDEIYGIVDGIYILVSQDEELKMVQIDGKVLYNYGKIENLGDINFSVSYDRGALFQFIDATSEENCIEVIYDPNEKNGTTKSAVCGGMAKPILYLYPEKTTNVTVTFEHPEFLETTYPKFTGKWQVTAKKDGSLYDKDDNYYYALYWDEKRVHPVSFDEGFYVERDDAIEFLEEKLNYIGLNDKERNEFIMYWLPILEKNEKSLVYFELTEERESYNKINIEPKPDSLLRVGIHIKKVDRKIDIKKQSLVKVQRKGFVAVEWGGTIY